MIEIKERQNLDEMATVCQKSDGYGIIIQIYSKDHGKIGDKRSPAHAHLFDTGLNELGEFVLTYDAPKNPPDVVWYRTKNPPEGYAAKIVKWSRGFTKFKLNNWAFALQVWEAFHPR